MIEKVNPAHPDKVADCIAGAIVDLAYQQTQDPKIAVEVLIGHGICTIIIETSVKLRRKAIVAIVRRVAGNLKVQLKIVPQDEYLAMNQNDGLRCGDNGIFKGMPLTAEEKTLSKIAHEIYAKYPYDGKYVLDNKKLVICQSNAVGADLQKQYNDLGYQTTVNPLGDWTGGTDVDTGATNRKLGSDMGHSVTGGGLHGKDLSKADVSINIYAFLQAQKLGKKIELSCAIGDEMVDGKPYTEIVEIAREYVQNIGGFEKLAEWGLY
ncbi:MAG: S-adenosylmethionine synthetase N-terminal domain-containing protein [Clostridia bacterium]|nr:S-adenosylmethionine synthetase N-terminal domain-containing protein [Clostridia bacterium]